MNDARRHPKLSGSLQRDLRVRWLGVGGLEQQPLELGLRSSRPVQLLQVDEELAVAELASSDVGDNARENVLDLAVAVFVAVFPKTPRGSSVQTP
jgi:hypothetical protein